MIRYRKYTTEDERELGRLMREFTDDEEYIFEQVIHERSHFEKAVELGYSPVYILRVWEIQLTRNKSVNHIRPSVRIKNPRSEDIYDIVNAPENKSLGDKLISLLYKK